MFTGVESVVLLEFLPVDFCGRVWQGGRVVLSTLGTGIPGNPREPGEQNSGKLATDEVEL